MKKILFGAFAATATLVLLLSSTPATASVVGQTYNRAAGTYNACKASLSTPAPITGNTGTVKACVQGMTWVDWSLQCGWILAIGATTPHEYWEVLIGDEPFDWIEYQRPWNLYPGHCYEIFGNDDGTATYYIDYVAKATLYAPYEWQDERWYCGIRASGVNDYVATTCGGDANHKFSLRSWSTQQWHPNRVNLRRQTPSSSYTSYHYYENYCKFNWWTN